MALFEWLSHETQRRGLDFLVIGGLASTSTVTREILRMLISS
jgi:hypothetical protein